MKWRMIGMLASLAFAGCASSDAPQFPAGVIVQGKVLKGGQPLAVPRADVGFGMVEIALVPDVATTGPRETATASADGTFEVRGLGKGVSPGTYKVAVFQRDKGIESDALEGAFSDENTPIRIDVPKTNVGGRLDLKDVELDTYLKK